MLRLGPLIVLALAACSPAEPPLMIDSSDPAERRSADEGKSGNSPATEGDAHAISR